MLRDEFQTKVVEPALLESLDSIKSGFEDFIQGLKIRLGAAGEPAEREMRALMAQTEADIRGVFKDLCDEVFSKEFFEAHEIDQMQQVYGKICRQKISRFKNESMAIIVLASIAEAASRGLKPGKSTKH